MRCDECGAEFPGNETCLAHFHALLAAEVDNEELRQMHELTMLTYHLQHPALTKPWYQIFGSGMLQRVFGQGENWARRLWKRAPVASAAGLTWSSLVSRQQRGRQCRTGLSLIRSPAS